MVYFIYKVLVAIKGQVPTGKFFSTRIKYGEQSSEETNYVDTKSGHCFRDQGQYPCPLFPPRCSPQNRKLPSRTRVGQGAGSQTVKERRCAGSRRSFASNPWHLSRKCGHPGHCGSEDHPPRARSSCCTRTSERSLVPSSFRF